MRPVENIGTDLEQEPHGEELLTSFRAMAGDASSREQLEVKGFRNPEELTTTKTLVIRSITYANPPKPEAPASSPAVAGAETIGQTDAMTEVTRELLDAKLDSVRAEVRASIAESSKETVAAMGQLNTQMVAMQGQMLTEMQGLRADFANMLKDVTKEMAATNVNVSQLGEKIAGVSGKVDGFEGKLTGLDGKITGLEGKIEGLDGKITGLDGKVTGLNSSISMLQWIVGSAIGLATIVLAIGAIFVAWMQLDLVRQTSAPQTPAATQSAPAQPPK